MAKRASDEICLQNYARLCDLFHQVVPDGERFQVVYACGLDVGMTHFLVVRKTTYTYSSYALGFDPAANEIVILPIDVELEQHGEPIFFKATDIDKAKQSRLSKEITIRDKRLPKQYIQFSVPDIINQDPDNVTLLVKQEAQAKAFQEFFKNQYSK